MVKNTIYIILMMAFFWLCACACTAQGRIVSNNAGYVDQEILNQNEMIGMVTIWGFDKPIEGELLAIGDVETDKNKYQFHVYFSVEKQRLTIAINGDETKSVIDFGELIMSIATQMERNKWKLK